MFKKREIPWLNVIQFHKEIVQMDRDNFFSLPLGNKEQLNSHRWTLIDNFLIEDMAGPWEISYESVTSKPLLEAISNKNIIEGYLGGPCWVNSKRGQNSFSDYLNPLFYISVKLELDEGLIRIIPSEGSWDISPMIYDILTKGEIEPEKSLEDMTHEVIEKAHAISDQNEQSLSLNLLNELFKQIPELETILTKKSLKNEKLKLINHPWTFFLPPTSSSPYTHHILRDYSELEQKLRENSSEIGGLKLLESLTSSQNENKAELLPIVPLNDSQRMAVSEILKSKPVTVISGPPGCGKSQVVVSLLLNAWANDISVLFSSTTNAAVDVVYDRLSDFDCEYPIAIRAGTRYKSNIDEAFRKLLNNVSANTIHSKLKKTETHIHELSSKKEDMQAFLDEKIPQEITEALRSALTSHADFLERKKELGLEIEPFSLKINSIGYNLTPEFFTGALLIPFQKWMEEIKQYEYQIELDSQQRIEIQNKLDSSIRDRNVSLNRLFLNPNTLNNFDWIIEEHGPEKFEKWLKSYQSLINQSVSGYLDPIEMKEEFLEWQGETEALEWINNADKLLKENQTIFTNYSKQHRSINEIRIKYDNKRNEIISAGLSESTNYDKNKILKWKSDYAYLSSIPSGIINIFKKKKANKQIQKTEEEIREYYPVEIWTNFSESEQKGRKLLNDSIDLTISWLEIQREWYSLKELWDDIENEFIAIQSKALELDLSQKVDVVDNSTLLKLNNEIELKKKLAFQAANTWEAKQKADTIEHNLVQASQEFQHFLISTPLLDSWMNYNDSEFSKTVLSLLPRPILETVTIAQRTLNDTRFEDLFSFWKAARESENKVQDYIKIINQIPLDKIKIATWWNRKPSMITVEKLDYSLLPQKDDLLWNHLEECKKIANEWKECSETVLKIKEKEMKEAYEWAIKYLMVAMNKTPEHMGKEHIKSVTLPLVKQSIDSWPIDELNEIFLELDPDRIKGKINKIDSELEALSFTLAKEWWVKRVVNDGDILRSAEDLYNHYRRNNNKIKGFSSEKFQKALSSVPIWTTTALSPQSIPMEPEIFDLLVIDEASQCTLTNVLPLIYRAKRIAIIGDPDQLPAIPNVNVGKELALASKHEVSKWLDLLGHSNNNVFQIGVYCLPGGRPEIISLIEHYRSHPLIIGFSNHYIYQKRLKLKKELIRENTTASQSGLFGRNVLGTCDKGSGGKSWVNPKEIESICELIQNIQDNDGLSHLSIGVVSPFAAQVKGIQKKLYELNLDNDITVGTAHTFQGDERDIIIFSPVIARGMTKGAIKFANSPNLINVSLTRAREALFVVGDFKYCKKSGGIVENLIKYIDTIMLLRDTSREELELFSWLIIEGLTPKVHEKIGGIEVDFVLTNKSLGIKLVIEVDGKQHYFAEINGKKYAIKFEVNHRYIEVENEKVYIQNHGVQEFAEIKGTSYPVTQTMESIKEDNIRDEFLKGQGFRVLRVPAKAVRETPTNVITRIKEHLEIV
ncbi:AAA domain-containing protein [Methanococcoides alaskense]|uniref:Very-short-patch-repair endonuclease n=1 Tax=Methanococcoides alaskense TaxID=325778 RepID=A0AA90Z5X6_9EURY|nr:AAA domain-containing protein [Methanococcoides alaskense]MDA0525451.1 AAA domain-containing protein [Methanococcoides alaskense]MDR6221614.1 very-short-patch-repair endonuclease [Methanococcoides alaskense]